ncbi:DUF1559 domain-containing protein [Kolteria novifilia]
MYRNRSFRAAFTLVELLVVIAIIGVLVSLLLPAVQQAREAGRRMQCGNNLKQLGVALHTYAEAHGVLPPGGMCDNELSWLVMILPMTERQSLYDQFSLVAGPYEGSGGTGPGKNEHALNRIPTFLCPTASSDLANYNPERIPPNTGTFPYTTHYYGVMGPIGTNPVTGSAYTSDSRGSAYASIAQQGMLYNDSSVRFAQVTDGLSKTFLIGETSWTGYDRYRSWVRGCDPYSNGLAMAAAKNARYQPSGFSNIGAFNEGAFGSNHPGGVHFLNADGSLVFLSENVDFETFLGLSSRNGGEPVQLD